MPRYFSDGSSNTQDGSYNIASDGSSNIPVGSDRSGDRASDVPRNNFVDSSKSKCKLTSGQNCGLERVKEID